MNDKYRKALLLIIAIFIVVLLTLGVSYAYMKTNVSGPAVTGLEAKSCAKISLIDSESTVINLDNTYPMSDNKGRQTEPYRFKISSFCEEYVGFNLYFVFSYDELQTNNIKYLITDVNTGEDVAFGLIGDLNPDSIDEFTDNEKAELQQIITTTNYDVFGVFNDYLSFKGEKEYDLRLWVDEDANNSTMDQSQEIMLILKSFSREETLADYIIDTYDSDPSLYLHDTNLAYGAEDYNYRYSGTDPNNYVCFGTDEGTCPEDNLYRIIGVFNNQVKLIKATYSNFDLLGTDGAYKEIDGISGYAWNSETEKNNWSESNLNKINLNTNYLNNIGKKWTDKIAVTSWKVAGITDVSGENASSVYGFELGENRNGTTTYDAKVGLMYVSDYMYAVAPEYWAYQLESEDLDEESYSLITDLNWMHANLNEWTITPVLDNYGVDAFIIFEKNVGSDAECGLGYGVLSPASIRPVFYLNKNVTRTGGTGTSGDPYRIS